MVNEGNTGFTFPVRTMKIEVIMVFFGIISGGLPRTSRFCWHLKPAWFTYACSMHALSLFTAVDAYVLL
jgi:hypothetical protein